MATTTTTTLPLSCRCGRVRGEARGASPRTGNRALCYCDDCQAFARWLGGDDLLDAHGGSDIYQMPPADVTITQGREELRCMRLSGKGMYRFYAACCRTPVGNLVGPRVPFVGIPTAFLRGDLDAALGPSGPVMGRFAIGGPPPGVPKGVPPRLMAKVMLRLAGWALRRKHTPSPYFDAATRQPTAPLEVLSAAERERLRALAPRA